MAPHLEPSLLCFPQGQETPTAAIHPRDWLTTAVSRFISTVARVAQDNVPGTPVESADPIRVPAQHVVRGERLSLFADGIARGESFETGDGSFCVVQRVVHPGHVILQYRDGFQKPARMRAWAGL